MASCDGILWLVGLQCETATILGHPIVITEQYPKAFKHTVPEIARFEDSTNYPAIPKTQFSMITSETEEQFDRMEFEMAAGSHAVLFGIEAHVCVQQTALDLLARGVTVHVVEDAVSSQRSSDRASALRLMQAEGALVTTTESLMLGLVGGAGHEAFKQISKLLVGHNSACYGPDASHWSRLESDGRTERV
jgi:hypothetical protein